MNTKRISINLISQLVSFACSLGISFFLTPYVVANLGSEAHGFVGLANNFTSFITMFTVALNGMLSKYITIEYTKKDFKKASGYFSTALITQGILAIALFVPMLLLASHVNIFVNISDHLVSDVKVLWALIFSAFLLNLGTDSFGSAVYAANRLDIRALISVASNVCKALITLVAFFFFTPHVWYLGLATIAANSVTIIGNYFCKKKLIPEVEIKKEHFDKKHIHSLLVVGIWNSLNKLQQLLQTGFDLLLANLFVSSYDMGLLSVSKTVPTQITALICTTAGAFEPSMTITYGKGDIKQFVKETHFAMKLCGFLCSVPILGFICFGKNFYSLWIPTYTDAELLKVQILGVLTLLPEVFSVYVFPLYSVNIITGKLKIPVFVSLGINALNIIIVLILLNTTNLGVYAIAGVSSILLVFRILFFVPLYAAHVLNLNWKTFCIPLLRGIFNIAVVACLFTVISKIFFASSWGLFLIICFFSAILGYVASFFTILDKNERLFVFEKAKAIFGKLLRKFGELKAKLNTLIKR